MNNITCSCHLKVETLKPLQNSLENEFEKIITQNVDVLEGCNFKDFLEPNEGRPEGIIPHFDLGEEGYYVAAGTERIFFNLVLANPIKCKGMIVRDINPRVKAYVDFNTLLLRLSKTRNEYVNLSSTTKNKKAFYDRISIIKNKLITSHLSHKIRTYYLNHLEDFGSIYLPKERLWRTKTAPFFKTCRYDLDDTLFLKVQSYAMAGNIISTLGSINDLRFLKTRKISIIDTTNITKYCLLNIKGAHDFHPRIIHTKPDPIKTKYFSFSYEPLSKEEEVEFTSIVQKIKPSNNMRLSNWMITKIRACDEQCNPYFDPFNDDLGSIYSKSSLTELRDYIEQNMIEIDDKTYFDMSEIDKLNSVSEQEIKALCGNEKIKKHLNFLVSSWVFLDPAIYLAFSQVEGWREEFENQFAFSNKDLSIFLKKLEKAELLDQFIMIFGQNRLNAMMS